LVTFCCRDGVLPGEINSQNHQKPSNISWQFFNPGFTEQSLESRAVPTVPVVDVAVTKQGSLMASGDVHGRVFLCPGWRWIGVAMLPKR